MGGVISGIGGAVGGIVGGIKGSDAQKKAANQQMQLAREAAQEYTNIKLPSIEEQLLQLQEIKSAGNLTPEQEQLVAQKESELNYYKQNPEAYTAQVQALKSLQELGRGGMTAMDRAQLNEIQNQVANQEAANRAAITQGYAQRGMGGSGVELAAQLAGNQAANQAAANQGFNVAAQAQQRALQAIQGAGQLGQGIESQQFGEAQNKAAAQNAINQFNVANQQSLLGRNVNRANVAQESNLARQQALNEANTQLANTQQAANKGLYQQQFENQLAKARGISSALNPQTQAAQAQGQAGANLWSGVGQGLSKAGTAIGGYFAQPNAQTKDQLISSQQYNKSTGQWEEYPQKG